MKFARLSVFLLFWSGFPALSHEFWIEPAQYQVETGAPLVASLRNGENFKGNSMAYFERRFSRFEIYNGAAFSPVEGRMGDSPALQAEATDDGLYVIAHETTPSTVTYRDWEKFLKFVDHKDFSDAVATHEENGWPTDLFYESYTRHAKALVGVGSAAGTDRAIGLETEFVALANPYDAAFDGTMPVRLLYQGAPRPDAQVEVFARAPDGTVGVTLHRTDSAGLAAIAVHPGHTYLFDAVVLRPSPLAGSDDRAPLWETLWAALTFAVPDK